jgi:hypothetical protein
MKNHSKLIWIVLALTSVLLLGTSSAAARPGVTRFEAVAYICEMDDAFAQWVEGGVLQQRGVILRSQVVSDEPRIAGIMIDLGHQDIIVETEAIRTWGEGTVVLGEGGLGSFAAGGGTWYTVWTGKSTDEGLVSRATGYGKDGLEGQFIYWEGKQLLPPFEAPADCPTELAIELAGFIRGRGSE